MKVLVLGATGFIGGHIVKAALDKGWGVVGFRRHPDKTGHLEHLDIEWVNGDLVDSSSLLNAMKGIDLVFHAAAFYPTDGNPRKVPEQVKHAKHEIQNILEATKQSGIKKFIYTSSLTTIGNPPVGENRLPDESDVYIPGRFSKSGYYESKIVMENAVMKSNSNEFSCIILNPTAVFGPGDIHMAMGGILIAISKGYVFSWLPGIINAIDVRDVAQAHVNAALLGKPGERYILGEYNYTIKKFITIVATISGKSPPRIKIPLSLVDFIVWLNDLLPSLKIPTNHLRSIRSCKGYNTSKAEEELNLIPRPFNETINDAILWFKHHDHW